MRTPQATEPTQETQRPWYCYNPLTIAVSLAQDIIAAFRMPFLPSTCVWLIKGWVCGDGTPLMPSQRHKQTLRVWFSRSKLI